MHIFSKFRLNFVFYFEVCNSSKTDFFLCIFFPYRKPIFILNEVLLKKVILGHIVFCFFKIPFLQNCIMKNLKYTEKGKPVSMEWKTGQGTLLKISASFLIDHLPQFANHLW